MSEEELNQHEPDPGADVITEEPAPPPVSAAKKWQMPEPVFRKTSGFLPQGFEKRYGPVKRSEEPPVDQPADVDFGAITMVGGSMPKMPVEPQSAIQPAVSTSSAAPPATATEIEPQPDITEALNLEDPEQASAEVPSPKGNGAFRVVMFVMGLLAVFAFLAIFIAVIYFLFFASWGGSGNFN